MLAFDSRTSLYHAHIETPCHPPQDLDLTTPSVAEEHVWRGDDLELDHQRPARVLDTTLDSANVVWALLGLGFIRGRGNSISLAISVTSAVDSGGGK